MKHDHRQSLWIIAGGSALWCYRCGSWKARDGKRWWKPTGLKGPNPIMSELADNLKRELKRMEKK